MKKRTKVLISTICALVMCFGIVGGVSAAVNVNSNGIIRFTGEDGRENTTDDIVFDASDITTLANEVDAEKGKVVAGKQGLVTAINSATASSSVPTNFETTEANLPDFAQLKDAINNVKKAGNEEVWAEIRNNDVLSGKTDTKGNIYEGVNSVDTLVQAIGRDNDNSATPNFVYYDVTLSKYVYPAINGPHTLSASIPGVINGIRIDYNNYIGSGCVSEADCQAETFIKSCSFDPSTGNFTATINTGVSGGCVATFNETFRVWFWY